MFKGIRNLSVLLVLFSAHSFADGDVDKFVRQAFKTCTDNGGTVNVENRWIEGNQECFKLSCGTASKGMGDTSVNELNDPAKRAELDKSTPKGAFVGAKDSKACRPYTPPKTADFYGSDKDTTGVSVSGKGGAVSADTVQGDDGVSYIKIGGKFYTKDCVVYRDGKQMIKEGCSAVAVSVGGGGGSSAVSVGSGGKGGANLSVSNKGGKDGYIVIRKGQGGGSGGGGVSVHGAGGVSVNGGGGGGSGSGDGDGGYVVVRRGGGYGDDDYGRGGGGGGRYRSGGRCTYEYSIDECYGSGGRGGRGGRGGGGYYVEGSYEDCIECRSRRGRSGRDGNSAYGVLSGIAELAGAIAPPLAMYGINAQWAGAYRSSNQAWAGAARSGFDNCRMMQNNYVNQTYAYLQQNELPDRTVMPPGCNGYQLGGFAGFGGQMGNGMGGFGSPWGAAGYSPGFMAGMYGPYGNMNPYGNMGGGFGLNLGLGGGMGMGGMPGMGMGMGGMPGMGMGGVGWGMGMPGMGMGMGGMGMPGFGGGLSLGLGGGLGMPGYGGWGTMPGGFGNGFGGGLGLNLGLGGGMGMPGYGGYGSGYGFNPYGGMGQWGGPGGMGLAPWGNGAGSYWNGSGGWGNGGGWGGGGNANWGNIQQSYAMNQQALQRDAGLQQMALGMNAGNAMNSYYSYGYGGNQFNMGNYGYAPYSPMNMGASMNMGFGFNF